MKRVCAALLLSVSLALVSCSGITVKSDFDAQADFSRYKTFTWMPRAKPSVNPLNEKRIVAAVEQQLSSKGLQLQSTGAPDFLVVVHTNVKDKIDVDTYGYRYGRYGRRVGTYTTVREYQQGTMVVDFIDAASKELFWRGWAQGEVSNPDKAKERIDQTIAKILAQYPPR